MINWDRVTRVRRMKRYYVWKQYLIEQLKLRPRMNFKRRLGLSYTVLQTPIFSNRKEVPFVNQR